MLVRVAFQLRPGARQQLCKPAQVVSLQVQKRRGEHDQSLIKQAVVAEMLQPQGFQNLVAFIKLVRIVKVEEFLKYVIVGL
jgi:hypothetical protein